jgi:hypothetical protein
MLVCAFLSNSEHSFMPISVLSMAGCGTDTQFIFQFSDDVSVLG